MTGLVGLDVFEDVAPRVAPLTSGRGITISFNMTRLQELQHVLLQRLVNY